MGSHPDINESLALEKMRTKLLADIARFHKDAHTFLPPIALLGITGSESEPGDSTFDNQWDDIDNTSEYNRPAATGRDTTAVVPERIPIALPSTLGAAACRAHRSEGLLLHEQELRVGQMNDALQAVRVGVGYKSFLYRHHVRPASSQRQKLRSFDEVHTADSGVLASARIYSHARSALERLYDRNVEADKVALEAKLSIYKPLEKADLKANTTLIEPSVRGVHQLHLPWFWNLDAQGDSAQGEWLAESKLYTPHATEQNN